MKCLFVLIVGLVTKQLRQKTVRWKDFCSTSHYSASI